MSEGTDEPISPEMIVPRRYTVAEIDQMRGWVQQASRRYGVSYRQSDLDAEVERKLRTYLLAGVGPEEVREAAAVARERELERWREMMAMDEQIATAQAMPLRTVGDIRGGIDKLRKNLNRT